MKSPSPATPSIVAGRRGNAGDGYKGGANASGSYSNGADGNGTMKSTALPRNPKE